MNAPLCDRRVIGTDYMHLECGVQFKLKIIDIINCEILFECLNYIHVVTLLSVAAVHIDL